MPDVSGSLAAAAFIRAPRDSVTQAVYDYWNGLRGTRAMPTRGDFDPVAIPRLLPHLILYGVAPEGGYTVRLVGEEVIQFAGRNAAGGPAGATMPPASAEVLINILDAVTSERAPKFRAGKAHWHPDKGHRAFEACFLPLSADGETVTGVVGCVAFPR
jgi:hypothetical protein